MMAVDQLDGLMLSPSEMDSIMDANGIGIKSTGSDLYIDELDSSGCIGVWGILVKEFYAGSGWIAVRHQLLRELDDDEWNHTVFQSVVLFSKAEEAGAFFGKAQGKWAECAGEKVTTIPAEASDKPQTWTLGEVTDQDSTLSLVETEEGADGWGCQRALGLRTNVIIDVRACSYDPGDQGVAIVDKISENIAAVK